MTFKQTGEENMAREQWVDVRLDWVPGNAEQRVTTIREASSPDYFLIQERLKIKPEVLNKWLRFFGWTVRVAVRNVRNIVGITVSEHTEDQNQIIKWWKSPRFENPLFMRRMFALAALEQPELPTVITLSISDQETETTVRNLGWKMSGISPTTNTFRSEPWKPYVVSNPTE